MTQMIEYVIAAMVVSIGAALFVGQRCAASVIVRPARSERSRMQ